MPQERTWGTTKLMKNTFAWSSSESTVKSQNNDPFKVHVCLTNRRTPWKKHTNVSFQNEVKAQHHHALGVSLECLDKHHKWARSWLPAVFFFFFFLPAVFNHLQQYVNAWNYSKQISSLFDSKWAFLNLIVCFWNIITLFKWGLRAASPVASHRWPLQDHLERQWHHTWAKEALGEKNPIWGHVPFHIGMYLSLQDEIHSKSTRFYHSIVKTFDLTLQFRKSQANVSN